MSFDALAWAAKQNTGSSGTKLVLLGLAECASRGHGLAFPSLAELVDFSSLDRKSVIANLDKLEADGFITDTGRKVGRTGQIKVYQVNLQAVPKTEPYQKRNSSEIPPNSPKNGTRNKSEPVSVSNDTGGEPPDPMKELFDVGVSLLIESGQTEKQARSLIGKWRKEKPPATVLAALLECRAGAISNPVEWLTKRLATAKWVSKSGYEYRGDDDAVLRQAEKRADWDTYWAVKGRAA